jgi:hypothetical protein
MDIQPLETTDPRWRDLYRIGGVAVIANLAVMLVSVAGYIVWPYAAGTTPTEEIFALIQNNPWAAFIALDLGVSVGNLISIFIYLALYIALRQVKASTALIALTLGLVALAAMIAARPVLEIFTLSNAYASAITEADKRLYLTAGESLLVQFHGAAWHTSILFGSLASLIFATLMRHSPHFGRALAYIGMVAFGIGAFFWLPGIGLIFLFLNMLGSVPWSILLGRALFRLAKGN